MKKKLLITLGCSYTEGHGAYDLTKDIDVLKKEFETSMPFDRFHANGWPSKLQKKLKYDKLINLGKAGSSNSYAVKRFFEVFNNSKLSEEYEVLVLWFMTFSQRISFYSNNKLKSIIHNCKTCIKEDIDLSESYANFVEDIDIDPLLEQLTHIKIIETACHAYNFNFLYAIPINYDIQIGKNKIENDQIINLLYLNNKLLNNYLTKSKSINNFNNKIQIERHYNDSYTDHIKYRLLPPIEDSYWKSPVCLHPNEWGYEYIAEKLFAVINDYFPKFINNEYEPELYENVYMGNAEDWTEKINNIK
jgi:hypothetical protein